jgi:hypothetical protein
LSVLAEMTEAVKAPRACFLDFPLGCPAGRPHHPEQQRAILRAAFEAAPTFAEDRWEMQTLPFDWAYDGNRDWEREVEELYRTQGIAMVAAHQGEHAKRGESLVGNERAFAIRCNC